MVFIVIEKPKIHSQSITMNPNPNHNIKHFILLHYLHTIYLNLSYNTQLHI